MTSSAGSIATAQVKPPALPTTTPAPTASMSGAPSTTGTGTTRPPATVEPSTTTEPTAPPTDPSVDPTPDEPDETDPTTDPDSSDAEPTDTETDLTDESDGEPSSEPSSEPSTDPPDEQPPVDSEFDIELRFENTDGELDPIVEEAFEAARQRWEQVIVGDAMDVEARFAFSCDGFEVPTFVDDLIIFITTDPIDGREGILGSAGPCLVRGEGTPLPLAGRMIFDSADLLSFAEAGRLEEIVLHEMGHVLGVGSMWEGLEMLVDPAYDNSGSADTSFDGERAIAQFDAAGGNAYDGSKVPVENMGGDGVANGHWRESVLGNELMTPFMSNLEGQLSAITIASLEDIGYAVSYAEADDYSWPPPPERGGFGPAAVANEAPLFDLSHDILRLPIQRVMNSR